MLCFSGEPGSGKTTLLQRAADELGGYPIVVRSASVDEVDRRRPLGVARALLPGLDAASASKPTVDDAITELEHAALQRRLAFLVDDAHWADERSLDVLRAIATRAEPLGVLLLVTTRARSPSSSVGRFCALAEKIGHYRTLGGLSDDGVAELAGGRLGTPPGALRSIRPSHRRPAQLRITSLPTSRSAQPNSRPGPRGLGRLR